MDWLTLALAVLGPPISAVLAHRSGAIDLSGLLGTPAGGKVRPLGKGGLIDLLKGAASAVIDHQFPADGQQPAAPAAGAKKAAAILRQLADQIDPPAPLAPK